MSLLIPEPNTFVVPVDAPAICPNPCGEHVKFLRNLTPIANEKRASVLQWIHAPVGNRNPSIMCCTRAALPPRMPSNHYWS